ncbi:MULTISPECIES: MerR family transcriptional regulator [unclassified Brachybacterium]|uniref:MerR family transcriptional regulator n=1 Tax=unclassified Brachybacterium TaxID=2623841 RepID=UPI00403487FD
MADERLLTISTFARAVGIPASALRHYAAQQVLEPADVDPVSGYRYYAPAQIDSGVLLQRMRSAAVPLPVMREVLAGAPSDGARLLAELATHHGAASRQRVDELTALRAQLDPAPAHRAPATADLLGTVLASAVSQVLQAAAKAAADVSGLVCSIGPRGIELIATDRYWLAHRHLEAEGAGREARAIISCEDAVEVAATSSHRGTVHLELTEQGLTIHDADGTLLARTVAVERAVPDLGRLVSTQPPARALAGFDRAELQEILDRSGLSEKLLLVVDGGKTALHAGGAQDDAPVLNGWATRGERLEVLVGRALFAAAIAVCAGEEIVLSLVDTITPVRVASPVQDTLTCLVMPMLP